MKAIHASVTIRRAVDDVFRFYRDFKNLPRFLGEVLAVEPTGAHLSRWSVAGPLGVRVHWDIVVTVERENSTIQYETVTVPRLRTRWEVYFERVTERITTVRELMHLPLGRFGHVAMALLGRFPQHEMAADLHRLQELMETGRITDTRHAIAHKFEPRAT
jgi:uncharacterized membrane protein